MSVIKASYRPALDRAVSVNIDDRSPKSKNTLIGRWRSFRTRNNNLGTLRPHNMNIGRHTSDDTLLEIGHSPPPAEDAEYFGADNDSFDNSTYLSDELSVKICKESLRQSILDHMKISGGDVKLLLDIENNRSFNLEELDLSIKNFNRSERNFTFLWAAFMKRHDLFDVLHKYGIDLNYTLITEGFSAIHLSSFSGCIKCIKWLIGKGCDINYMPVQHTPLHCAVWGNTPETVRLLINNGAKIADTVVHYAVRANAIECLQLLLDRDIDVNSFDLTGTAPLHIAADRRMSECMQLLLSHTKLDLNVCTREKGMTALHYAAESGYTECVQMLLARGADYNKKNKKGQTPLHLAAKSQSVECIESLLSAGSNVNERDNDNRTPLHAAVGKALLAFNSVEALLKWKADVNVKDRYGYTALHIAALNELIQCVDLLITNHADVSSKTKGGVSALSIVSRKTPICLTSIRKRLNDSISLHDPEASNREVELKLDFRYLLPNCCDGEVSLLKTLIDEGQKNMLEHPLCSAFLYIKWLKIRRFYFCRLFITALFVFLLTAYVLTSLAHYCYNSAHNISQSDVKICLNNTLVGHLLTDNPKSMEYIWYVLVLFSICEIVRKLMSVSGYSAFKNYFFHLGNIFEWFTLLSVFMISFQYKNQTYTWQNHIAAFAILFGWANLMLMVGQLPVFGTYVAMFTKVLKEFFKLLVAYLCVLIGFTISFCVIFPTNTAFRNPLYGIIKVLVMMTGELDIGMLQDGYNNNDKTAPLHITAYFIYTLFVLFISVVLMNLVVGIAVHDIQGLSKTAGLSKLVRQAELISFLELALFQGYLPKKVVSFLRYQALISPACYRVVLHVKPLNPMEKRLPKYILMAAYDIAKGCTKSYNNTSNLSRVDMMLNRGDDTTNVNKSYDKKTLFGEISKLKEDMHEQKMVLVEYETILREILSTIKSSNK